MSILHNIETMEGVFDMTTLEKLSKDVQLCPCELLNEPIDMYGLYARDAPSEGLDNGKKQEIKDITGWPDSVVDNIRSSDEAEIYQEAKLDAEKVDGRDCLIRTDIDYCQEVDGQTNLERMKQGKCPYTTSGQPIELHHIGQNPNAPLAELSMSEHRGAENDLILHDKTIDESRIDRSHFRLERENHWKARAEQIENQENGKQ